MATLKRFWARHPAAEQPLKAWCDEVRRAKWSVPQNIKDRYVSISFVSSNRVVFNIKGDEYRLIVAVAWRFQAVYIKFVGTRAEYNRVDDATVEKP